MTCLIFWWYGRHIHGPSLTQKPLCGSWLYYAGCKHYLGDLAPPTYHWVDECPRAMASDLRDCSSCLCPFESALTMALLFSSTGEARENYVLNKWHSGFQALLHCHWKFRYILALWCTLLTLLRPPLSRYAPLETRKFLALTFRYSE